MHIKPLIRALMLLACLSSTAWAYGAEPVRIGVLAFRPKPQTLARWQPLAAALKQAIPERDFVVQALTFSELQLAATSNQLDFVLTSPGHYVMLTQSIGLSAPLATLVTDENGKPTSSFGGVIFCRTEQANINTLSDIKGKTVAITSNKSFGGYQMQAYELKQGGVNLPQDAKLIITGMPHDNVVDAVLAGRADVGFVRAGVLDSMAREGRLDMKQIKIINLQNLPDFPAQISTRLYPEWAFTVMPHVDENLARHVAAALFLLSDNTAATHAMDIHGFVVPPDYTPVADMLKELRFPPFEAVPAFTLDDVLTRFRWHIIGFSLAIGLILLLGFHLLLARRKLASQHRIAMLQKLHVSNQTALAIAHELNQPLLAISAYSKAAAMMIKSDKPDFDEINLALDANEKQAYRAGKAIRDMLDSLMIHEFDVEVLDLNREIIGYLDTVRYEDGLQFKLILNLDKNTPSVRVNRLHLGKVLSNLLQNSFDAMREAGVAHPSITVTTHTINDENIARITLQDNGPGINIENLQRIFEPFFSTKTTGLGMGLAVSRTLIEENGGKLWIDPQEGTGATFHFTLPLAT